MRKQTPFGIVVVESINHILIIVSEWMSGGMVCACQSVCCVYIYNYCLLGDNGRQQYLRLFVEVYANVVFVISCAYSTASLTLVRE